MAEISKRMQQRLSGEVMDVDAVAEFLGFSTTKVRRLFERQVIKAKKIGAQWRCLRSELDKFMTQP